MNASTVRVNLSERSYDIIVRSGALAEVGAFARQRSPGSLAFIVTDEHVTPHARVVAQSLRQSGFHCLLSTLPAGENQKSLPVVSTLYDSLLEARADRRTLVVAVGGGVIGDLAGFVAATYARGLPLLMVPTTLLAMVDSSVGGKVAVNHPRAKNLIGTFYQPIGVCIDIETLITLPDREFRSGLAEVAKYGVILDPDLFAFLETNTAAILRRDPDVIQHIVTRCCRLKADVVEKDERDETGLRAILNYGHTFAHAFETVGGYGAWLHGEAVAAGMMCASRLAERRGLISHELSERQAQLFKTFGLPTAPDRWPVDELLATMRSDKKALSGRVRLLLPSRLGEVVLIDEVAEEELRFVLADFCRE